MLAELNNPSITYPFLHRFDFSNQEAGLAQCVKSCRFCFRSLNHIGACEVYLIKSSGQDLQFRIAGEAFQNIDSAESESSSINQDESFLLLYHLDSGFETQSENFIAENSFIELSNENFPEVDNSEGDFTRLKLLPECIMLVSPGLRLIFRSWPLNTEGKIESDSSSTESSFSGNNANSPRRFVYDKSLIFQNGYNCQAYIEDNIIYLNSFAGTGAGPAHFYHSDSSPDPNLTPEWTAPETKKSLLGINGQVGNMHFGHSPSVALNVSTINSIESESSDIISVELNVAPSEES